METSVGWFRSYLSLRTHTRTHLLALIMKSFSICRIMLTITYEYCRCHDCDKSQSLGKDVMLIQSLVCHSNDIPAALTALHSTIQHFMKDTNIPHTPG